MLTTMARPTLLCVAILATAACSTPQPTQIPPGPEVLGGSTNQTTIEDLRPFLLKAGEMDYPLFAGDLLRITVQGHEELTIERRIPPDGMIPLYGLGNGEGKDMVTVKAAGKRVPALESELRRHYSRIVSSPYVTVRVTEYAPKVIYIAGAVNEPSDYRLPDDRRISLVQALTMAGWLTAEAKDDRVQVIRVKADTGERIFLPPIDVGTIVRDRRVEMDIYLDPGDTITVDASRSESVYIYGMVMKPGEFPHFDGMTVTRLISLAGGLKEFAKITDIRVLRQGTGPEPQVYSVDLQMVFDGEASDFLLRPGDVLNIDERFI